jgi:hypothetical protein
MPPGLKNQGKIRGWPRRIRALERLREEALPLPIAELDHRGFAYRKLVITPFYRLEKRQPPYWYRRLCIAALVEIGESWRAQLNAHQPELRVEVWLFHPHFIASQVVVGAYDPFSAEEPLPVRGEYRWPGDPLDRLRWCTDSHVELDHDDEPVVVGTRWRGMVPGRD